MKNDSRMKRLVGGFDRVARVYQPQHLLALLQNRMDFRTFRRIWLNASRNRVAKLLAVYVAWKRGIVATLYSATKRVKIHALSVKGRLQCGKFIEQTAK